MSQSKPGRWLQVAQRASEFRMLLGSSEVALASQKSTAAEESLRASRSLGLNAQAAWRDHLSKASFHAADDAQFRRFQGVLNVSELQQGEFAEKARKELADTQAALRQLFAEKKALHAAVARANERARVHEAQQGQREADEVWTLTQRNSEGTL